jgi:osmotically inducible lipoprotein OsmB
MKTFISVASMVLAVGLLSACTTSERQDAGMVAGGVLGGVTGGALTGGSTAGVIAGAVGGGYLGRQVSK